MRLSSASSICSRGEESYRLPANTSCASGKPSRFTASPIRTCLQSKTDNRRGRALPTAILRCALDRHERTAGRSWRQPGESRRSPTKVEQRTALWRGDSATRCRARECRAGRLGRTKRGRVEQGGLAEQSGGELVSQGEPLGMGTRAEVAEEMGAKSIANYSTIACVTENARVRPRKRTETQHH